MRNAKLWSVLLAAVLLCACALGIMFTGASASDTRIPTATATYVVGTDGDSIRECLVKASEETWAANSVLEIQFSGTDTSAYGAPDPTNGVSGWILFETATIFREDDTQLPIVIRGMDADRAAKIHTGQNTYCATNDYFFTNLTMGGGAVGKMVTIYAGSGELVFENTHHSNYLWTKYFGDNSSMDAYVGWDAAKVAANSNEKGLMETGLVFGKGCTGLFNKMSTTSTNVNYTSDDGQHMSAVGFNAQADCGSSIIASLKRTASDVKEALTEDQLADVREEAKNATFYPGNLLASECPVKPGTTATYLVVDLGTVATKESTTPDFGFCSARRGTSPIADAKVEIISGGIQFLGAGAGTSKTNETYVGDTTVIMRGGRSGLKTDGGYSDVGIRLSNNAMFVGNLTLEIHEDDPDFPTWTPWIQCNQGGATSTVFGDFHFLMTGGTIGEGTASSNNDGYWGAPLATGTIVNEVRGGKLWSFSGSRYSNSNENTPVSTVLPGTGETLAVNVTIHNKISGGEFGGVIDGAIVSGRGFYGQCRTSGYIISSVCNEITGGTFYAFNGANNAGAKACGDIYNFVSGTAEDYPSFKTHFYGTNCTVTTPSVTNVIKGYPQFVNLEGKNMSIYGGCKNGTVTEINNYLGGMPVFDDFYGGISGAEPSSSATNRGIAIDITNTIALDMTEKTIPNYIWGGNGYYQINGIDGATKDAGNSDNLVSGSITCNIYSGHFGTFRAESACGTMETCPMTTNVYGGKWTSNFMTANRTYNRGRNTGAKSIVVTTNIYDGEFSYAYMGGQNSNDREFVNNIYGGTFNKNYFGGGAAWAKKVTNNIYGGTFKESYYGGGASYSTGDKAYYGTGSEAVVNNIYGGTFSGSHDYMGTYANPSTASNICETQTIENNFYGGDFGKNWVYCGHRNGTTGSITNHFYSGEDNPVRDPENELYKYYDADGVTTTAAGTYFRDQVVTGTGYSESGLSTNTIDSITNTFEGGGFVTGKGGTNITIRASRWSIVGDITNNFIKGQYYRVFGGCDYGYVTGTITNNYGTELEEGEAAPELSFSSYVFGGGSDATPDRGKSNGEQLPAMYFSERIAAAKAAKEALDAGETSTALTATQKSWLAIAEQFGDDFEGGAKDVVNNIYYGTYHQFSGGSYGSVAVATAAISHYDTITNNIYGGVFEKLGDESTGFAGGCWRNAVIGKITNNIKGGRFNVNYYGGSVGTGKVECPEIINVIDYVEGCETANYAFYMGNGAPTYNGTVTTTINGFKANKSYIYGGSAGVHNQPETAEYGILTTINGGEFSGVWGLGGGKACVYTGNLKTVVNGGTFNGFDSGMPNALMGGARNATMKGNSELVINDGIFNADVIGGTHWGSQSQASDTIYGNVTTTINGGIFNRDIYPLARHSAENLSCTGTVTLNGVQTEGKTLKFTGKAPFDTFTANGEAVEIAANTSFSAKTLNGKIVLKQVEGWAARDYATLPAGSEYDVAEAAGIYGAYTADDSIVISGIGFDIYGATLRLGERIGVRVLLDKNEVDAYGDAFTYSVSFDGKTIASGTKADLVDYQGYYSFVYEGIGLSDFAAKATVSSPFFNEDLEISIVDLATIAKNTWTGNWLKYAEAILEFDAVYNNQAANTKTPDAVSNTCTATAGAAGVQSANATLLMSDAAGIRINATLAAEPANLKVLVNGTEVAGVATVKAVEVPAAEEGAEATTVYEVSFDLFFAHESLAEMFTISVESDAGVHMTYQASIEALASQLANDEENEMKNNATAFLYYIQRAVNVNK